ncbi:thioredoxin family protein [Sphingosinicella sp. BN140058]|uniref:thioredoxin family protein n=1 Tax=Sphingosinicella sp. BN140058 TaxID=1892855 RepID=UPI00101059A0|nr:thioredoxin family protein [Sphingosinicella sp. BN140058]QAY75834.1 thioredoxin family protein [Sphingosinicella sp. BN140058]
MKHLIPLAAAFVLAAPAMAAPQIGSPAPNFRLVGMNGQAVSLDQYKGKIVVLEWNNPGCPFVKKHYGSGNMQKTQAAARNAGVVWLTINSSAAGKQGHMDGAAARAFVAGQKAQPTAYLLDPAGTVGRGYGAVTTPHMYVIDRAGRLVYAGGIDDKPTANPADVAGARNHVLAALGEVAAGKKVSVPTSRPYGCNVKYKDS